MKTDMLFTGLRRGADRFHTESEPTPGLVQVSDAQLGRSQRVDRDGVAQTLVYAEGRSQDGYIATVHVGIRVPLDAYPAGIGNRRAPLVGLLGWGQGGARFEAEIDLRTGAVASVVASSIMLAARFDPATAAPDDRALFAELSGAVVWGTRPGRARTTRTLPPATIAVAPGAQTFAVPPFAATVTIYTPTAGWYAAGSASVITLHGGPLVTDDPELAITAGELGTGPLLLDGLLLSGNTRFVTIANALGVGLPVQLTFGLEL